MEDNIKLDRVEDALEDFRNGKFLVVVDDEDRENEGDLIIAAEKITPEDVNFMLKNARGVLCAPVTLDRCARLGLTKQVDDNTSVLGTPFTVTVDKLEGCSTGVSIQDRAATIRALADPASTPETFGRPGHINPLYAQDRGVLQRAGHTEAAVDPARLAALPRRRMGPQAYKHTRPHRFPAEPRLACGNRRGGGHADHIRPFQAYPFPPERQ